jgi:hypothetical protein
MMLVCDLYDPALRLRSLDIAMAARSVRRAGRRRRHETLHGRCWPWACWPAPLAGCAVASATAGAAISVAGAVVVHRHDASPARPSARASTRCVFASRSETTAAASSSANASGPRRHRRRRPAPISEITFGTLIFYSCQRARHLGYRPK